MKNVSPNRDIVYQESLGEQLLGLPTSSRSRLISGAGHNILMNLASGQPDIRTPLRSRLDSQDSRNLGVFQSMKGDENTLNQKNDQQF